MTRTIAIIGCGLIGAKRAEALKSERIVACADPDPARAKALAARFGAAAVEDPADALALKPDIAVIATPHDRLAPLALAAIAAGSHLILEKPAARSAAELEPVAAAAKAAGRLVKVGFNHRFHPAMQKAKTIVDSGVLGPLFCVRGRYGHGGRVGYEKEWRFTKSVSGGGELIDQGAHLIDLARWYMGELDLDYAALPRWFWPGEVEDNALLALKGTGGAMAWLSAGWSEWKNIFSLEIAGRDGKLQIDGLGGSYGTESLTHYHMLPGMGPPETTRWEYPFPDASFVLDSRDLLDCLDSGRRPCGDVDDALAMLRIVDAAYARAAG